MLLGYLRNCPTKENLRSSQIFISCTFFWVQTHSMDDIGEAGHKRWKPSPMHLTLAHLHLCTAVPGLLAGDEASVFCTADKRGGTDRQTSDTKLLILQLDLIVVRRKPSNCTWYIYPSMWQRFVAIATTTRVVFCGDFCLSCCGSPGVTCRLLSWCVQWL